MQGEFFESIELVNIESPQQAVETLGLLIKIDKNNLQAYKYRATAYQMLGSNELAFKDCEEIIRINPKDHGAYFEMGRIFQQQKKYEKAAENLTKAIMLNKSYIEAYCHRCEVYLDLQELKLALEDRSNIRQLMKANKIPECQTNISELDNALEIELKFQRGLQLKGKKDFQNAIIFFTEVIQRNKDYKIAYFHRASCHQALDEHKLAIQGYQKFLELEPTRIDVYVDLSSSYHVLNMFDESLENLGTALALEPKYGLLYYQRCIAYCNLNDFLSAKSDLKEMKNLCKYDPLLLRIYQHDAELLSRFIEAGIKGENKRKSCVFINPGLGNLFGTKTTKKVKKENLNVPNNGMSDLIKKEKNNGVAVNNLVEISKSDFFSKNGSGTLRYYRHDEDSGENVGIDTENYQQMVDGPQALSSVLNL